MFVAILATQIFLAFLVYSFASYGQRQTSGGQNGGGGLRPKKAISSERAWAATSSGHQGLEVHNDFLTQQMYPRRLGLRPFYDRPERPERPEGPINV